VRIIRDAWLYVLRWMLNFQIRSVTEADGALPCRGRI
jgi:hypothetical protein